ncbi:uncharacterized protein EV420DRAFT_1274010, partial [Desarmillaria tabescens]
IPTPLSILKDLVSSSALFLVSSAPLHASLSPPKFVTSVISPLKRKYSDLLNQELQTKHEANLCEALQESEGQNICWKGSMIGMQATAVLQNIYIGQSQLQLQSAKEKSKRKRGDIMGNGLLKMMTGDAFFGVVTAHKEEAERARKKKAQHVLLQCKQIKATAWWAKEDKRRVDRNNKKHECFHQSLLEWQDKKRNGHSTHGDKPKLADFGEIEKAFPKYTQNQVEALSSDEDTSKEEEEEGIVLDDQYQSD